MVADPVAFLELHALPFTRVFVRLSGLFVVTPVLSVREIPMELKGWLAAGLALVIYPLVAASIPAGDAFNLLYGFSLVDEAVIGLVIGLIVSIFHTSFLMAGQYYSIQLGFGIVNVLDPLSDTSVPVMGQLKSMLGVMAFIVMDGHHMVIEALVESFRLVPTLTIASSGPLARSVLRALAEVMVISFKMALPVLGAIFLVEFVMGIMSKIAPQMNIMVAGFQIKIVAGLFLVMGILPVIWTMADRLFDRSFVSIRELLFALGGAR